MKLSLSCPLAIFLLSVPESVAFTAESAVAARKSISAQSSVSAFVRPDGRMPTRLAYQADNHSSSSNENLLMLESLAFSLNLEEETLNEEYQRWRAKYEKVADPVRYVTWKRNYLMQEVWNRTNGENFDLNEFGDFTREEFDQMKQGVAGVVPETSSQDVSKSNPVAQPSVTLAPQGVASPAEQSLPTGWTSTAIVQQKKFKKVKTFSGAYNFVPNDDGEMESRMELVSVLDGKQASTQQKEGPRQEKEMHFQKVPLFCGGFRIVPIEN